MAICYKKLWKLLIDLDMQKKDLRIAAGLSTNEIQSSVKIRMFRLRCLEKSAKF